jgi:hypothetical protein
MEENPPEIKTILAGKPGPALPGRPGAYHCMGSKFGAEIRSFFDRDVLQFRLGSAIFRPLESVTSTIHS